MDSIKEIKKYAEEIAGNWNGDESGLQEERAQLAQDVLEAVVNLEEALMLLNQ